MRNVARKGDPTSTGGAILDGDGSWLSEGSPTTYIGMIATCPACKVGQGPIVAVGPRSIIGPGGPVALQGDYVACGCPPMSNTILPAQGTTVGDNQGGGASARAAAAPASTQAPVELPANAPGFWPPYNPITGKQLDVTYTHKEQVIAFLTLDEARELWNQLNGKEVAGNIKTVKDSAERVKLAHDTAKGLGGLGVLAYTKVINGEPYTIVKNYQLVRKTIPGNIWKAGNPNILRLGIGVRANTHLVKMGIVADIYFTVSVNLIQYWASDERDTVALFGNIGADITKGLIASGIALALTGFAMSVLPVTVMASGIYFVAGSIGAGWAIDQLDDQFKLTEKLTDTIRENVKE